MSRIRRAVALSRALQLLRIRVLPLAPTDPVPAPRILVVDDDRDDRAIVMRALERAGMTSIGFADGPAAQEFLDGPEGPSISLVLLDVNMPSQNGWEFLERCRRRGHVTPVIFLTGQDELESRVHGLELGADDYVPKSRDFKELIARIHTVLRRGRKQHVLAHGDLEMDLVRRAVRRGEKRIELSNREFDLLRVLATEPGRVWTRAELLDAVWNIHFDPETNVVNVHIARLRRKIDRHGPQLIHTVRGEGYVFALETPPGAATEPEAPADESDPSTGPAGGGAASAPKLRGELPRTRDTNA